MKVKNLVVKPMVQLVQMLKHHVVVAAIVDKIESFKAHLGGL
jgi:hypothetical protein